MCLKAFKSNLWYRLNSPVASSISVQHEKQLSLTATFRLDVRNMGLIRER